MLLVSFALKRLNGNLIIYCLLVTLIKSMKLYLKNNNRTPSVEFYLHLDFCKLPFNFRIESVKAVVNETDVKVTKRYVH